MIVDLLREGADPDVQSRHGTPLAIAIDENGVDIACILLVYRADTRLISRKWNLTPLQMAEEACNIRMTMSLIPPNMAEQVRNRRMVDLLKGRLSNRYALVILLVAIDALPPAFAGQFKACVE